MSPAIAMNWLSRAIGRMAAVVIHQCRPAAGRQEETDLLCRSTFGYHWFMASDFREVDPAELRLPPSRLSGADPFKLHRQIALYGDSADGMPPVWVYEGSDGVPEIINGATRATRIAKLAPGVKIRVEVIGTLRGPRAQNPKIGDRL